jgi:hypothetical protein
MIRKWNVYKAVSYVLALILLLAVPTGCALAPRSVTGGTVRPADNINLKAIDIVADSNQTVLTLSLISGSRKAGYPESKLTRLPAYEITALSQPYRLKITLDDISFWDYEQTSWDLTGLISGLFREVPAYDNSLVIYVQLSREAEYSVTEDEGSLVLTLSPGVQTGTAGYYCVTDGFYEHQEGAWPEDIDMTPVLCTDGQNKLLISQAFPTQAAAEAYQQQVTEQLAQALPGKTVSVIYLEAGALPDYAADIDYSLAEGQGVLLKDGALLTTPVLLNNGRYLATSPDGTIAFSRVYQPGGSAAEQDVYLSAEKIWTMDMSGRIQSVDTPEFFSIASAAYSGSGRYLAMLDISIENRVLYVYDFVAGILYNMGEEGLGSQTSSFAWSDTDDMLYAMSGNENMQLHVCEFAECGSFKIGGIEERPGAEGNLAVSGNRVFFADIEAEKVYEIGGMRYEVGSGVDVRVSPDAKKLLILDTRADAEDQVTADLKIYDIEADKTSMIVKDARIEVFCFGSDGKVYYTQEAGAQSIDGYPYALYVCDRDTGFVPELAALASTPDMAAGGGKLYFIKYIGEGDSGFFATYIYDPGA